MLLVLLVPAPQQRPDFTLEPQRGQPASAQATSGRPGLLGCPPCCRSSLQHPRIPHGGCQWHLSFQPLRAWIEDPLQLPLGGELGRDGNQTLPAPRELAAARLEARRPVTRRIPQVRKLLTGHGHRKGCSEEGPLREMLLGRGVGIRSTDTASSRAGSPDRRASSPGPVTGGLLLITGLGPAGRGGSSQKSHWKEQGRTGRQYGCFTCFFGRFECFQG